MDIQSMAWLSELEMEEPGHIMKQHPQTHPSYTDSVESFSSRSLIDSPSLIKTNQSPQLTTDSRDVDNQHDSKVTKSCPLAPSYGSISNTFTISFGNPTLTRKMNEYELYEGSKLKHTVAVTTKEETSLTQFIRYMDGTRKVRNTKRNRRQAQEHVVAERKRREKLAERFISLSALLPGLKKNDKATVLEDASKYILQLQARVKELEETSVKGKGIIHESAVASIGRCNFTGREADGAFLSDDTYNLPSSSCTYKPDIKARIIRSNMLLRIYCRKSSTLVQKTLNEIRKLQMTIICCSILPFDVGHIITITAQMGDEMVTKRKDLVKYLKIALKDLL